MNIVDPKSVSPCRTLHSNRCSSILLASVQKGVCGKARQVVVKNVTIREAEKEAMILTKLASCPYVIKLLGVCEAGGFEPEMPYNVRPDVRALLLEHASRGDAFEYLLSRKKGRFGERLSCKIVEQVLRAIAACHEQGLVHLDIKSENVFIRRDGTAVLGDFGMSENVGERLHTYKGTLTLMPPEIMLCIFSEETLLAHPSMDMWCLGAMCLELLNGKHLAYELNPPEGTSIAAILNAARVSGKELTLQQARILFSYCMNGHELKLRPDTFEGISALARQFILSLCSGDASRRPQAHTLLSENPWILQNSNGGAHLSSSTRKRMSLKSIKEAKTEGDVAAGAAVAEQKRASLVAMPQGDADDADDADENKDSTLSCVTTTTDAPFPIYAPPPSPETKNDATLVPPKSPQRKRTTLSRSARKHRTKKVGIRKTWLDVRGEQDEAEFPIGMEGFQTAEQMLEKLAHFVCEDI